MDHFTPYSSLAGGILIGLAAGLYILLNGRIAGISGIIATLPDRTNRAEQFEKAAFVIGLILGPAIVLMADAAPLAREIVITAGYPVLMIAGILVGFGTRMGSGCTSGHGICGLSRLSVRSLVATLCFMLAGFATVGLLRHIFQG